MSSQDNGAGKDRVSPEVHYNRGIAALRAGEPARALTHFQEAIRADGRRGFVRPRAIFLSYYGFSRALAGNSDRESVQACELAVARDSFDPKLHLNLARVYLLANIPTRALSVLERGLRLHPSHQPSLNLLAKVDRRSRPAFAGLGRDHLLNRCIGRVRKTFGTHEKKELDLRRTFTRDRVTRP